MSSLAQVYNNILSFGGVGIANKFGGGWQKNFYEPHAATINGRTYHKTHSQSSSNPSDGIEYIFFVQKLNENGEKFDEIKLDLLGDIFNEMKDRNPIAKQVYTLDNFYTHFSHLNFQLHCHHPHHHHHRPYIILWWPRFFNHRRLPTRPRYVTKARQETRAGAKHSPLVEAPLSASSFLLIKSFTIN